jgi:hypothetical protein
VFVAENEGGRLGKVQFVKRFGRFSEVGSQYMIVVMADVAKAGVHIAIKVDIEPLSGTGAGAATKLDSVFIQVIFCVEYEYLLYSYRIARTEYRPDIMGVVYIFQYYRQVVLTAGSYALQPLNAL